MGKKLKNVYAVEKFNSDLMITGERQSSSEWIFEIEDWLDGYAFASSGYGGEASEGFYFEQMGSNVYLIPTAELSRNFEMFGDLAEAEKAAGDHYDKRVAMDAVAAAMRKGDPVTIGKLLELTKNDDRNLRRDDAINVLGSLLGWDIVTHPDEGPADDSTVIPYIAMESLVSSQAQGRFVDLVPVNGNGNKRKPLHPMTANASSR